MTSEAYPPAADQQIEDGYPAGGPAPAAELWTFLIADIRGYTRFTAEHGDEAAAALAGRLVELASDVVGTHDGRIVELRGDEVLAVFPSARKALRAAVELQSRCSDVATAPRGEASAGHPEGTRPAQGVPSGPRVLPALRIGIGLDAGEAVPVSGGYRGGALNLAARLCGLAAPGEVLASETVSALAGKMDGLDYVERASVPLKGFTEPVRIIEVRHQPGTGSPASVADGMGSVAEAVSGINQSEQRLPIGGFLGSLPTGALVGRERELDRILGGVDATLAGSGRLVMLAGEPGAGKTRLAQQVTLVLRNRGFLVGAGSCFEPRQAFPYYPFLDALVMLYDAAPAAIRAQAPERWPYLGHLLLDAGIEAPAGSADAQDEQERIFRAVTGFVQAVAEQTPVALLLDDVHWADSSSLDLLAHLARHTRGDRVFLLGAYRDVEVDRQHPLERVLRDLHRQKIVERVQVSRLPREDVAALLAAMFEENVSTEFADLVFRHTEGNPFFVCEVLRALIERGDVYRDHGRWQRRDLDELTVPESIRSAVGERVGRLDGSAQEILREASVLGQTFAFDDLLVMSGRSEEEIESTLGQAEGLGLVRETVGEDYRFDHALTQGTLYRELTIRRRRRLHLAAGAALERLAPRAREQRVADLAWHFLQGDDGERALPYSVKAGDAAEAVFAHAEAEQHYRTALELAEELEESRREPARGRPLGLQTPASRHQTAEILEKLGVTLHRMGRCDEALELLERGAALCHNAGDTEGELRCIAEIGHAHRIRGTTDAGIRRLQTAIAPHDTENVAPTRGLALVYASLHRLLFAGSRYQESYKAAMRTADLARALDDLALLAGAEVARGTVLEWIEESGDEIEVLEHGIAMAERAGDMDTLDRGLNNLAGVYMHRGDFVTARAYAERSLALSERIGTPGLEAYSLVCLGQSHLALGDWAQAEVCMERAVAIERVSGVSWYTPMCLVGLGGLYLGQGKVEEALHNIEEAMKLARGTGDFQPVVAAQAELAAWDMFEGRPESALRRIDSLFEGARERDLNVNWLPPMYVWALVDLGREAEAADALARGVARATERKEATSLAQYRLVYALLARKQRRWADAISSLEEGLSLARRIQTPVLEALLQHEYGQLCIETGKNARARKHLEAARAIFTRLGAAPFLRRTEEALAVITGGDGIPTARA